MVGNFAHVVQFKQRFKLTFFLPCLPLQGTSLAEPSTLSAGGLAIPNNSYNWLGSWYRDVANAVLFITALREFGQVCKHTHFSIQLFL